MYQYEFTGRCPSKAQIKKHIVEGLRQGNWVQVSWGENQITVERVSSHRGVLLDGTGWIRRNGGYDLAREVQKEMCK